MVRASEPAPIQICRWILAGGHVCNQRCELSQHGDSEVWHRRADIDSSVSPSKFMVRRRPDEAKRKISIVAIAFCFGL